LGTQTLGNAASRGVAGFVTALFFVMRLDEKKGGVAV